MSKLLLTKVLFLFAISSIFGQANRIVDCTHPDEKVHVNAVSPKLTEKYDPAAETVFTFEEGFNDTISIVVGEKLVLRKHMQTNETGAADRVHIKADPNATIIIQVGREDCIQFIRRKGYKYIYVDQQNKGQWTITYSNYKRYYF